MFWTWILQHSIAKFCSLSFLFQIQFSRSPISALLSGLIDYKINTNPEWSEIELNQFIQVTYIYSLEFIMIYLTAMPKGLPWRRLRFFVVVVDCVLLTGLLLSDKILCIMSLFQRCDIIEKLFGKILCSQGQEFKPMKW